MKSLAKSIIEASILSILFHAILFIVWTLLLSLLTSFDHEIIKALTRDFIKLSFITAPLIGITLGAYSNKFVNKYMREDVSDDN